MALTPATIKPAAGAKRTYRRVGRGHGSTKGTTAGRGTKGQRARSGGVKRTTLRGFRPSLLKIPKVRGFKSMYEKPVTVTLTSVARVTVAGDVVTPRFLAKHGLTAGHEQLVKIVGTADNVKKISVKSCAVSASAKEAIEKAGGSIA